MTARNRLVKSVVATAFGPFVTILLQLVNVPVFLRVWGAERYGEWLLLSAIPTYLALSDLGFGSVAGNDMTMRVAGGDKPGALCTFQSTWALISMVSLGIVGCAVSVIWFLPLTRWMHIVTLTQSQVRIIFMLQAVEALFILQASLQASGFRSDGKYALGVVVISSLRIATGVATLAALFLGAKPYHLAIVTFLVRIIGTFIISILLRRAIPWLEYGFGHATKDRIRSLVSPAVSFMAFPAGQAFSMEGIIMAIGVVLGPAYVAVFSPMRTLTRSAFQVLESIKNGVWPELSAAYGANDFELARKLHRYACRATLYMAVLCIAGLWVLGPFIFRIWTHQRVALDMPTFHILLLGIFINAWWNTSSAVPMAANKHQRTALYYMISTVGSLALAFVLLHFVGLKGAAIALLFTDAIMAWLVMRESNRLIHDDNRDFLKSLLDVRWIVVMVRTRRLRA